MSSIGPFEAIKIYLDTNWSATPLRYENDGQDPPVDGSAWVFVEVTSTVLRQIEIGSPESNAWQESGVLFLHVYIPYATGTEAVRRHAKDLANLFRGRVIDHVVFGDVSIGFGQPGKEDGLWWGLPVSIEWTFEDH